MLSSGRLPHAIVLEGESGLGKRTLARELAQAIVCRADEEQPCGKCTQCIKAEKSLHPDIFEYSAPGGARSFHIDVVRDVVNHVYMSPNEAEYKIYILGNAHCMNENAQNAILKVLEEPPAYAVFILTVQSRSMLLPTVLSRSVVLSVTGVDARVGAEYIAAEHEEVSYNQAFEAVNTMNGNIGAAIRSLADGKMKKITQLADNICSAITANNEYELIKCTSVLGKDRQELIIVLTLLKTVFRDALAGGQSGEILSGREQTVKNLKQRLTQSALMKLYTAVDELLSDADKNANHALLITKICYSLRRAAGR